MKLNYTKSSKNKKNILFYFLSLGEGGAQRQTVNLISEFDQEKYNIYILTRNSNNDFIIKLQNSINIRSINMDLNKWKKIFPFVYELFFLTKHIIDNRINIIYARGYSFYIKSGIVKYLLRNIKIIAVEANSISQIFTGNNHIVKKIKYNLCRITLNKSDVIYCLTDENRLDLVKTLNLQLCKIKVFPVIFNSNNFNCLNNSKKPDIFNTNKFNSVIIGRFVEQKNQTLAIKSFFPLDDSFHLHIIGEGKLKNEYIDLILSKNKSKMISVHSFRKDIYEIIYHADIILHTSIFEGFGNVLLESLLIGKPIISTRFVGIDNFILSKLDQMGLLLNDFQPETLTDKIIEVRNNYSVFKRKALDNRKEISDKYSLSKYLLVLENDIIKLD